jgi:hypothetical protein
MFCIGNRSAHLSGLVLGVATETHMPLSLGRLKLSPLIG